MKNNINLYKPKKTMETNMAETGFGELDSLKKLIEVLGGSKRQDAPKTPIQEAREALRREYAKDSVKIYIKTLKRVGNDLEFSSTPCLFAGLLNFVHDGVYTFWEQANEVLNSQVVKEIVRSEMGEGKTLVDLLISKSKNTIEGKDTEEMLRNLKLIGKVPSSLAEYCQENNKSPDAVLKSKKDMLGVIEKAYGSFEGYEKSAVEAAENLRKTSTKMNALDSLPYSILIPIILEEKFDDDLNQFGVNTEKLGNIVQSYAGDFVKVGKAYMDEMANQVLAKLDMYKKIAGQIKTD